MDAWGTAPEGLVTSTELAKKPEAESKLQEYRLLMNGQTVTAVDPLGRSWSVKVDSVIGEISATPYGTFRLIATWTLQVEAAGP